MKSKVTCTRTRWQVELHRDGKGCVAQGWVDFSREADGRRVNVYSPDGYTLLWYSTGVRRCDRRTALSAFQTYVERAIKL